MKIEKLKVIKLQDFERYRLVKFYRWTLGLLIIFFSLPATVLVVWKILWGAISLDLQKHPANIIPDLSLVGFVFIVFTVLSFIIADKLAIKKFGESIRASTFLQTYRAEHIKRQLQRGKKTPDRRVEYCHKISLRYGLLLFWILILPAYLLDYFWKDRGNYLTLAAAIATCILARRLAVKKTNQTFGDKE